jgi:NADPH:quinone reductase-like Zn-dependent oxidoreductase
MRMTAALQRGYGSVDLVELAEVDRPPPPTEDRVVVRVRAASVNRADLDALGPRPGFLRPFLGWRAPRNPRMGIDVAGVVEAVGPEATRLRPGDAVMGDLFVGGEGGAFAEYVTAPERAFQTVPPEMSFARAATLPHSAILALQGLRRRDGRTIGRGDRVLIDGASGNVGPFAVQIAKSMGADVTGVASASKLDRVREIGADRVLDYAATDYTRLPERYDWIVDTDSHHGIRHVRRALRPNGVYVTLGGDSGPLFRALLGGAVLSRFSDRWSGLMLWWKPMNPPDVDRLKQLLATGRVRPIIDRTFRLTEIREALRVVDERRAFGKVVIDIDRADEIPPPVSEAR